jgi:hypothetical protein
LKIAGLKVKTRKEVVVETNTKQLSELFANAVEQKLGFKPEVLVREYEGDEGTELAARVMIGSVDIQQIEQLQKAFLHHSIGEKPVNGLSLDCGDFYFALELIGEAFPNFNGYVITDEDDIDIRIGQ